MGNVRYNDPKILDFIIFITLAIYIFLIVLEKYSLHSIKISNFVNIVLNLNGHLSFVISSP